jgi:hypothetical protein
VNRAVSHHAVIVGLVAVLTFGGSAPARAGAVSAHGSPPVDPVVITISTMNGSGCAAGSVALDVAADNASFQLTHSAAYRAQIGGGARPTDFRKNCQVAALVRVPRGYSFAVTRVDYRGRVDVASGATAALRASFYWAGSAQRPALTRPFAGPSQGPWETADLVDPDALIWSFCGYAMSVSLNTELRVARAASDRTTTSAIWMGSPGGDLRSTYHLAWRECARPPRAVGTTR